MKARNIVFLLTVLSLSGCGGWARHNAANNLEESEATYKACLMQAAGDVTKCTVQKQAFQADLETNEALRGRSLGPQN